MFKYTIKVKYPTFTDWSTFEADNDNDANDIIENTIIKQWGGSPMFDTMKKDPIIIDDTTNAAFVDACLSDIAGFKR